MKLLIVCCLLALCLSGAICSTPGKIPKAIEICQANPAREWQANHNTCSDRTCSVVQNGCFVRPLCLNVGGQCICRKGLVDDGNGNCIKANQCPRGRCNSLAEEIRRCKADSQKEWQAAGSPCVYRSCWFNGYGCSAFVICDKTQGKCVCRDPLVEDENGDCIKPEACPRVGPCYNLPELLTDHKEGA